MMNYILFPDLTGLHVENCGIAILNPGWKHPKRKLDTSVLILGRKSIIEIGEDSTPLTIEPGKITILTAGKTHRGLNKIKESSSYFWIHFKCTEQPQIISEFDANLIFNNRAVAETLLQNSILIPQEFKPGQTNLPKEDFHELLYEQENPSFTVNKYQMMFKLMLIQINEFVLSVHKSRIEIPKNHSLIYSIIQNVYENLSNCNFSVKVLAEQMQYNPDYLGRLFKSVMKKSIGEYIIDRRIALSVTLLTETDDTISSISRKSGFNSMRNFLRQFKSRKEQTPSELRTRHKIMHITNI